MDEVVAYMKEESGKAFEPRLIDILLQNIDAIIDIKQRYNR
jgi:response regulator RpfG family c-di-GMP phosphodiesterase